MEQAVDVDRLWSVVRTMRFFCEEVFGLEASCDCYVQLPSEDLLVVASSEQGFPGPPPRPFASRVVASRHLLGGAALATSSVVANDLPDVYTNTNHQQEGSPDLTLAIPTMLSDHRVGQFFVSLIRPRAHSWTELEPLFVCLTTIAKQVPARGAVSQSYEWMSALAPAKPTIEFEDRLVTEIARAENEAGARLGIFVISAPADESTEGQPASVRQVLDVWAKTTALVKAGADDVYSLDYEATRAYAFIRSNLKDAEWQRWRDGKELRMIQALRPDNKVAGWLGGWVVPWRQDVRLAASSAMGPRKLFELMRDQVRISALRVLSLNEMRTQVARGNYVAAYSLSAELVKECGRACGVAIHELVRMALQIGQFRTAFKFSTWRKSDADWDIEGPLNCLLAAIALGDLKTARQEASPCRAWLLASDYGNAESTLAYPMVRFACSLVPWLESQNDDARTELTAATHQIGSLSGFSIHLENCLKAIDRWQGNPSLYANAEEDIEAALDAFSNARRGQFDELEFWWELESMRRLIVVLRGYLVRTKASAANSSARRSGVRRA
jgi:hypothetical protein